MRRSLVFIASYTVEVQQLLAGVDEPKSSLASTVAGRPLFCGRSPNRLKTPSGVVEPNQRHAWVGGPKNARRPPGAMTSI